MASVGIKPTRPPVLAVLSQKGGTGKTTLSCAIAALAEQAGHRAVLLDVDPQGSACNWHDLRQDAGLDHPDVLPAHANRLERMLDRMAPLGATLCVIDTAPHSGGDAFTVATVADHILIPVQPSAPDLRAIHQTIQIAESADTPATVVINRAIVNHPTIAQSHRILAAANVAICPVTLHQRIAHSHAFNSGRCAAETEPGTKAAVELVELYDWLVSARALPQADTKEPA